MEEPTRKKAFYIHENHYEQLQTLNDRQAGRLFRALFEYHRTGLEPEYLDPLTQIVFITLRQTLDQDRITYDRRVEANRENGKKGGRPRKNKSETVPKTQ